eukprot:CAMPEP_0184651580 /NCGR_PEP_ID=MMETSP0308-20130426/9222_1 /TAXON_ID=38269 /ORGANISM="Gloeochaete witrockiana, Strain SAG 46.84" /LENGTH=262 /DNA_ID=CAMNT_0027085921 /DNA_START=272 /DNA_END=1060 /DNA_ORIENTATION=-
MAGPALLSPDVKQKSLSELSGWKLVDGRDAITKTFTFNDFKQAWAFMGKVADKAEELGHHPEWFNVWNRVDITLSTHDAGGLSQLDVDLAKAIESSATSTPSKPIQVGDTVPTVTVKVMGEKSAQDISTDEIFKGKKVVLFAVPGAFTPTCSLTHLPGFVDKSDEILAKGVDKIVCLSTNDAYVMDAWGKQKDPSGRILFVADGSAVFSSALGLALDLRAKGMGIRTTRFAAIVDDGVVKYLGVEEPGKLERSTADAVLQLL